MFLRILHVSPLWNVCGISVFFTDKRVGGFNAKDKDLWGGVSPRKRERRCTEVGAGASEEKTGNERRLRNEGTAGGGRTAKNVTNDGEKEGLRVLVWWLFSVTKERWIKWVNTKLVLTCCHHVHICAGSAVNIGMALRNYANCSQSRSTSWNTSLLTDLTSNMAD